MARSKAACPAMAKYLIAVLALAASALADDAAHAGGYAAPSAYSPPVESYPAESYAPPGDTYGAPDPYNPAPTYEDNSYAPQDSYGAVADDGGELFDLAKITELLPLFLAVFAAIIVAQLFAPLLAMLFGAKVGLANGLLAPLQGILFGIVNAILAPFMLAICDISGAAPVVATMKPVLGKRSFGGLEADMVDALSHLVLNSISAYDQ